MENTIMGASFAGQKNLPRGLRDNNPGNIRPNHAYTWLGQIGIENNYVVFTSIEYGLRAMAMDLKHKIMRGLDTIEKYVPVYAPKSDNNDPDAYARTVSKLSGIDKAAKLNPNKETIKALVKAHIFVEVGGNFAKLITDEMVSVGVEKAF